jgi:hypothetical protein
VRGEDITGGAGCQRFVSACAANVRAGSAGKGIRGGAGCQRLASPVIAVSSFTLMGSDYLSEGY